jgi:hypothetical protein
VATVEVSIARTIDRGGTRMDLTIERIEQIRAELAALPPAPRVYTTATKVEAIERISAELLALRKIGYDLETLAALLSAKGLAIAVGTLKNYLRRFGATPRKRRRRARAGGAAECGKRDGT